MKKPISKKQDLRKFIFKDDTYDWDVNYETLIKEYVNANFSFDKDNRRNNINDQPVSDMMLADIVTMFELADIKDLDNINSIKKAISVLCNQNPISKSKEAKIKAIEELPDKLAEYINKHYGNDLSYNKTERKTYYKDRLMIKNDYDNIMIDITSNTMFKGVRKYQVQTIIDEVSKRRTFEVKLDIDMNNDDSWNILRDVNPDNWEFYLKMNSKGALEHNVYNYSIFLSYHPQFKGKLSLNLFDKIESMTKYDKEYGKIVSIPIDDDLMHLIEAHIEQYFGDFNIKYVERALTVTLQNNSYHEIKKQFKDFEEQGWDGKPRMHEIMIKYFGCKDCSEIREMTEVMLCGSVQRIIEEKPDEGTMFDYMGIMFGIPSLGKTKFLTRLYLGPKYTAINPRVDDDQIFTDLSNRAWLVLFDEMRGIDKSDMPTVKSRITEQGVNVRLSYARRSKYYPRHNVFWGNTNYQGVLRDEGYERRFLIFECQSKPKSSQWWNENYTDYDIQQIWAETLEIYHKKWEGKVIEISDECKEYNYNLQIKHKVWVEDPRTNLELEEITNYSKYNYPIYNKFQWRLWMKTLDELKNGHVENHGNCTIKLINTNWIYTRITRKKDWIDGIMRDLGWKIIEINDENLGNGEFFIRNDENYDEIKREYDEKCEFFSQNQRENIDLGPGNLPF